MHHAQPATGHMLVVQGEICPCWEAHKYCGPCNPNAMREALLTGSITSSRQSHTGGALLLLLLSGPSVASGKASMGAKVRGEASSTRPWCGRLSVIKLSWCFGAEPMLAPSSWARLVAAWMAPLSCTRCGDTSNGGCRHPSACQGSGGA